MLPTANLVYKTANSSINYINSAIEYVNSLGYYSSVFCESHELRDSDMPEVMFILTGEQTSGYISRAQYTMWQEAEVEGIPVFVIYKRKQCNELNVYTASIKSTAANSDSSYAYIWDFSRTDYDTFYIDEKSGPTKPATLLSSIKAHNHSILSTIEAEEYSEELLLLL